MFKKIKITSVYFLLFVVFFNCIFVNIVLGMSMLMTSEEGPADRIRSYEDQIFTYSQYEGFVCRVEGIVRMNDKTPRYLSNSMKCNGKMKQDKSCDGSLSPTGYVNYNFKLKEEFAKDLALVGIYIFKGIARLLQCKFAGDAAFYTLRDIGYSTTDNTVVNYFRDEDDINRTRAEKAENEAKQDKSVVGLILTTLLDGMISEFIREYLGDNDYMIDTSNSDCNWIKYTNVAVCATIAITSAVLQAFNTSDPKTLAITYAILTAISNISDGILVGLSNIEYKTAAINFDTFSMCGAEWLVVGSDEIEEELVNNVEAGKLSTTKFILNKTEIPGSIEDFKTNEYKKVLLNSKMDHYGISDDNIGKPTEVSLYGNSAMLPIRFYPSYGDFNGSYKRLLDECFSNRRYGSCNILFPDFTKQNKSIDDLATYTNKAYREYIYGGMEYEYSGCEDPRPERSSYGAGRGQQYYFRGSQKANFACERFATSSKYKDAHRCCLNASQKLICIKGKYRTEFSGSIPVVESEKYVMCGINEDNTCELPSAYVGAETSSVDCSKLSEAISNISKTIDENSSNMSKEELNEITKSKNEIQELYDGNCGSNATNGTEASTEDNSKLTAKSLKNTKNIAFKIKKSLYSNDKYCVETENLCPYNFKIAGGTELLGSGFSDYMKENIKILIEKDDSVREKTSDRELELNEKNHCELMYDEATSESCKSSNGAKCKKGSKFCKGLSYDPTTKTYYSSYRRPSNFCQLDRHCTRVEKVIQDNVPMYSPFVDKACFNMVGSSHNFEGYRNAGQSYSISKNGFNRLLIAPLVECTVETFRNFLLNTAGHTRCSNNNETSFDDISCDSGIEYAKGDKLDEIDNIKFPNYFMKLQKMFVNLTKIFMTLMVVLYGFNLANGKESLAPAVVTKKILTLVLVSYFSISSDWVRPAFKSAFGLINYALSKSMELSQKSGDITNDYDYGGCYFFKNRYIDNNYDSYGDKNYLAVFDTLDCKIAMYMGYLSDAVEDPPILGIFLASLLTFGIVIILVYPILVLFIIIISISLKIAFLFIEANLRCCLLLFFAPIIIPTVLFEYSKGFFTKWLDEIRKTLYSSIFLVVGLNAFLYIFDGIYVGDAKFIGTKTPLRNVYCGKICKISDDNFYFIDSGDKDLEDDCKTVYDGEVINLKEKAPICFFTAKHKKVNTKSGILNFFVNNFLFMDSLGITVATMYNIFLEVIMMCVVAYVFKMSIEYLSEANSQIFGTGFDDDISKDIMAPFTRLMSSLANFGFNNNPLKKLGWKLKDKVKNKLNGKVDRDNNEPNVGRDKDPNVSIEEKQEPNVGLERSKEPNVGKGDMFEPNVGRDIDLLDPNVGRNAISEPDVGRENNIEPNVNKEGNFDPDVGRQDNPEPDIGRDIDFDPNVSLDNIVEPDVGRENNIEPNVNKEGNFEPNVGRKDIAEPNIERDNNDPNVDR